MLRNIPSSLNISVVRRKEVQYLSPMVWIQSSAVSASATCIHSKTLARGGLARSNLIENCRNIKNNPTRGLQTLYINRNSRNESPESFQSQTQPTSSLPLSKSARFMQRNESFLKESSLYENTTFRPNAVRFVDLFESRLPLEDDVNKSLAIMGKGDFSPRDYIEYFRSGLINSLSLHDGGEFLTQGAKNIKIFNKDQIYELLKEIAAHKLKNSEMHQLLRAVDQECSRRVTMWGINSCLLCVDLWLAVDEYKFVQREYWKVLIREMETKLMAFSLQNTVQFLFYVGIAKSAPRVILAKLESKLAEQIDNLSAEELGIACDGFFKNNYQLTSTLILETVSAEAKRLMTSESIDRFSLIRMLKILRHAQKVSDDLCLRLVDVLKTGMLEKCNLTECAHFAATVASGKMYDDTLFNSLETLFLKTLEKENVLLATVRRPNFRTHPSQKSRPKDVARILWSLSETSHEVQHKDFESIVVHHLELCMQCGYFNNEPHVLLDSLLSLAVLKYYPIKLIHYIFSSGVGKRLLSLSRDKPIKQLQTLSQIVSHECPDLKGQTSILLPNLSVPMPNLIALEEELQSRPALQVITDTLNQLVSSGYVQPLRVLPYIGIAGFSLTLDSKCKKISASVATSSYESGRNTLRSLNDNIISNLLGHKKQLVKPIGSVGAGPENNPNQHLPIAIEILDHTTSIKGTGKPTGLMNVKLRHLNYLKYKVLVIDPNNLLQIMTEEKEARISTVKDLLLS